MSKRKTVLIVEDNVALGTCLEMLLEAHGYEVWRTADGIGGFESIKLKDFDAIICDLVMPGLSGHRLHEATGILKPQLCDRFIFMSGHPDNLRLNSPVSCPPRPVLQKPFAVEQLLEAIDQVIHPISKPGPSPIFA